MKKRNLLLISTIMIMCMVAPFVLGACAGFSLTISAPALKFEDGVVSWNSVSSAKGYQITLYDDEDGVMGAQSGESFVIHSNKYALTADGVYWVGVRILSGNEFLNDSPESYILVEKKDTQSNVEVPGPDDPDDNNGNSSGSSDTETDVFPSNAPALCLPTGAVQKFNYISSASIGGISVPLTENTGVVSSVSVLGTELDDRYWSYDSQNGAVELELPTFSGVDSGIDTKFTATTSDGENFDFYVTKTGIANLPVSLDVPSYGAYVYCKNSSTASDGLTVSFSSSASIYAISVDGVRIANSTSNYSATSKSVVFKEGYLNSLSYGLHEVQLFTGKGILDFYLFVYSSSIMCYDLQFDFDDSYPDVILTWQVDYPIDRYEVVVNGDVYSSDEYPDRFDGNSFSLKGIIGESASVCIRSYVQSVDTPASSATVNYADQTGSIAKYLDPTKGFTYLSKTFNRYIDSTEEMDVLAYYMILYYDDLDTKSFNTVNGFITMSYVDVYVDSQSTGIIDASGVMNAFKDSCAKYKESLKYTYAAQELSDGAYRIGLSMTSKNEALYDSESKYTESSSNEFHLTRSSRSADFDDFAINGREGAVVETSDQLFFAVEAGFRPLPVAGSIAENLYALAKDVCRTWIDDDMTDYEKVHAIYDWLGKNVVYDYNLVSSMEGIKPSESRYDPFYSYDSFYLEGVFENGIAVCNGISKTFVLLCAIEGITAVKVNGTSSGGAHAWNKVYINEKWYIVDSTWSNQKSTNYKESFTHEFLLITTEESASSRTETTEDTLKYYCGDTQYTSYY